MKPRIYKWHGRWYCDTHRCATTFCIGRDTPAEAYDAWDAVRKLLSKARAQSHDPQVMDDLNKQASQLLYAMDFAEGKDQSAKVTWKAGEIVGLDPSVVIADGFGNPVINGHF